MKTWSLENVPVHGFPVTACEVVGFGAERHFNIGDRIGGPMKRLTREFGFLRAVAFVFGRGIEWIGSSIKRRSIGKKGA